MPAVARARESNKALAKKLYLQGKRHFKAKQYAEAVAAFKNSYAKFQHRNTLYNIALSYAYKGDGVAAFRYLWRYLRQATAKDSPLDEILERVRTRYGMILVMVPDRRAGIYVDGRLAGRGRAERVVSVGTRALEVRQGNRVVARRMIDVTGGRDVSWKLGALRVVAGDPKAEIYVDGRLIGRGRMQQVVDAGTRIVEIRQGHRVVARRKVSVVAGRTATWRMGQPHVPTSQPGPRPARKGLHWAWFTSLAAVTVAVAAGATAVSFETKKTWEKFEVDRANHALADRGKRLQLTANVLWGVTAAAAVGTVLMGIFTRWRGQPERPTVTVAPTVGPGGIGAMLRWMH